MPDLTQLSDRDLLITLVVKVDDLKGSSSDHESRLRALESKQEVAAGQSAGRVGFFDVVNKATSTIWAVLAVAGMLYLWFK